MQPGKNGKKQSLDDLKRQLDASRPLDVDSSGRLLQVDEMPTPQRPDTADIPKEGVTRLKPSRFFAL